MQKNVFHPIPSAFRMKNDAVFPKITTAFCSYDAYDTNQDCYTDDFSIPSSSPSSMSNGQSDFLGALRLRQALAASSTTPIITDGIDRFIDQGSRVNIKSTDPFGGFPCYWGDALTKYLNLPELRDAIHVPKDMNIEWQDSS